VRFFILTYLIIFVIVKTQFKKRYHSAITEELLEEIYFNII